MEELVYMVFSWDSEGEIFLYMSTYKQTAIEWAQQYYNNTKYHTWIERNIIELNDFCPCDYCNYIPNDKCIVWERKTEE